MNQKRKHHEDQHFCNSQVNQVMEFGIDHSESVDMWSCDDKNKVLVGENTPAVARQLQIRSFFMTDDAPNYTDHDFPLPNSKIIPP